MNRPERAKSLGLVETPPEKRQKIEKEPTASDLEVYERHVAKLFKDFRSNKWILSAMCKLLDETHG